MERVAPFAATIPAELSWTPLEGGRSWAFFATSDDLRGVMAPGMTFSPLASARAEVEFEVAEEFLRRHRLELLARFPAGVEVGGRLLPWSSLELRMPSASDPLASFRGLDPDERVWLADGSLRASEAERIESDDQQGLIYVLVNFR